MDMLGHDYVADHDKMIALPHLLQHFKEQIAVSCAGEPSLPSAVLAMKSSVHEGALSQMEVVWL